MTIDPTREEWLEERANLCTDLSFSRDMAHRVLHIIFGPCPPEPPPEKFRLDGYTLVRIARSYPDKIAVLAHLLTPDEADAMACSLIEHAAYAREQEAADDGPICGGLRMRDLGEPLCLRPKGHAGACAP